MKRTSVALAAVLVTSLMLPVAPATAQTVSITPSSEITFDNQYAQTVRFDALGRAWIWNTVDDANNPSKPRLAIFARGANAWTRVQTVRARSAVETLRFDVGGKAFATNSRKNEIATWRVSDSGSVGREKRVSLRGRGVPLDAFPSSSGDLFVLYRNRIVKFDLPLRRKEKPIRTIKAEFPNFSKLVALPDGTLFVTQGDSTYAPIEVFDADKSGVADPTQSILIDVALAPLQSVSDISLTPAGKVAVAYWGSGVAIFETNASGNSVTPTTWYPQESPLNDSQGVDFMSNGVMGVADYMESTAVKVFFEE